MFKRALCLNLLKTAWNSVKRGYLKKTDDLLPLYITPNIQPVKGFKCTVVSRALPFLYGKSLEITLTVPLSTVSYAIVCFKKTHYCMM